MSPFEKKVAALQSIAYAYHLLAMPIPGHGQEVKSELNNLACNISKVASSIVEDLEKPNVNAKSNDEIPF